MLFVSHGLPIGNTRIAAVLSPTGECKGDLDNDGDVDGSDLAVFAADFGRTDCDTGPPCEGDFDHDNDVDGSDLAIFAGDFGRTDCQAESVYYYHNDHLGTPHKMTDVNGAVVWSADYRPFGQADVTVNTVTNNFRFPGQYENEETGLHYNWHRYYDPGIGRYLRADPSHSVQAVGLGVPYLIPFLLDKPQELNVYAYVQNDPVSGIDPLGLYQDVGGGFGVTAGIVSVSVSIHTESCRDEQGRKHLRTIQTMCIGWEIGLGLKGSHGASASIGDDQKPKKCPKMFDDSGGYSEDSGVWGAIVIGRSYSTSSGTGGWKVGLGGGWNIYSGCRNDIIEDVVVGQCCDKQ